MHYDAPILLDVTRLVTRSWTARRSTGIDRVCYAYLDHYRERAQAVVQYRGIFRVLDRADSARLFALLEGPTQGFRKDLLHFAPGALARGSSQVCDADSVYLNVSHTEFDLDSHWTWAGVRELHPVYLIHDLIPIAHEEYCRPHAVQRHYGRVSRALQSAAGIIVNSHATHGDLTRFASQRQTGLPPVLVAPLAGADLKPGRVPHRRPTQPYFLCVGTFEPRKNHQLLLELWRWLAKEHGDTLPLLVCIGQWGAKSQPVRQMLASDPVLQRHVVVLDDCSDDQLANWMAGALALLQPSMAEGFGLPLVEALAMGTPVVASDLPCFRENGQGLPVLLHPQSLDDWARVVVQLWRDPAALKLQRERTGGFRRPLWQDHFAALDRWLAEMILGGQARDRQVRSSYGTRPAAANGPGAREGLYELG